MIYTLLSLALLAAGVVILRRNSRRETSTVFNGLGYLVGAVSVMLWPEAHSHIFDAATRTPGFGRLLNDVCATLVAIFQFAFITSLAKAWSRWRRIAVGVYGALLALFSGLWSMLHLTQGRGLGHLMYAGYATESPLVRVWNTIVGLTILYVCVLATIGYMRANGKIRNRYPRVTTAVGSAVWATFTLYGGLVVAQLAAAWLGRGDIGIRRFLGPIVVVSVAVALVQTVVVLFGPELTRHGRRWVEYGRQWVSLTEKQARVNRGIERLEQLLIDNTNAAGVAIDQRAHLDKYADATVIDAVDAHLEAHGISHYQRKAGRQAVRYLILNRANAARPLYDEERHATEDEDDPGLAGPDDEGLLVDLSRREQEHLYLHADAARIAGLVILMQRGELLVGGRLSELEPRWRASDGWRREVAALIVEVLRARARAKRPTSLYLEKRAESRPPKRRTLRPRPRRKGA